MWIVEYQKFNTQIFRRSFSSKTDAEDFCDLKEYQGYKVYAITYISIPVDAIG